MVQVPFKRTVYNICQLCVPYKQSASVTEKVKVKLKGLTGKALKRRKKKLAIRIKAVQRINPSSDISDLFCLKSNSR